MRILIMVLSYDQYPFDVLMNAQRLTWDSIPHKDVRTVYYRGGNEDALYVRVPQSLGSVELRLKCTDKYYYMSEKFKLALDWCLKNEPADMIFRTNSSSYVNKKKLVEFAKKLPKEKCYCGWSLESCVSGAGFFISPDCAKILADNIDVKLEKEEDFHAGQILLDHGIKIIDDKSRIDYPTKNEDDLKEAYHIRFKTANRLADAENMYFVHDKIISNE